MYPPPSIQYALVDLRYPLLFQDSCTMLYAHWILHRPYICNLPLSMTVSCHCGGSARCVSMVLCFADVFLLSNNGTLTLHTSNLDLLNSDLSTGSPILSIVLYSTYYMTTYRWLYSLSPEFYGRRIIVISGAVFWLLHIYLMDQQLMEILRLSQGVP